MTWAEQCNDKSQLLRFDIAYIEVLLAQLQLLQMDAMAFNNDKLLLDKLRPYSHYAAYLNRVDQYFADGRSGLADTIVQEELDKLDNKRVCLATKLDSKLVKTYKLRRELEQALSLLCQKLKLAEVQELLDNAELVLDTLTMRLNANRTISITNLRAYTKALDSLQQFDITLYALKVGLGNAYPVILTWQTKVIGLVKWLDILRQSNTKAPGTLNQVLAVKELLIDSKSRFYLQHCQTTWFSEQILLHKLLANLTPAAIMQGLIQEEQQYRQAIKQIEQILRRYSLSLDVLSGAIRLWTTSFYSQLAHVFVASTQVPALGSTLQLSSGYLKAVNHITAACCLSLDLLYSRYLGPSYSLLQAIGQQLTHDVPKLMHYGSFMGLNESQVIKLIPALQWSSGLALQLGLALPLLKLQPALAFSLAMSYIIGHAGIKLSQRWLTSTTALSGRQLVANMAAYLGGAYLGQQLAEYMRTLWVRPDASMLLANSRLCQQHASQCQQAALKELGLSEHEVTWSVIRKRTRELARTYHPDVNPMHYGFFSRINQAQDRLKELTAIAPSPRVPFNRLNT